MRSSLSVLFSSLMFLMTRTFTESSHSRLYTMYVLFPLKVGILEQNLKQRDTFYENVFKHGFLFELSH